MAYKRTRKGAIKSRRVMKRGFGIRRKGSRKITATKVAKISKAVLLKNTEVKYTRNFINFWIINFARKVTASTRDLINSSANPSIMELTYHPPQYTGKDGTAQSNHARIGNKIENVKVYGCLRINFMNYSASYAWAWKYAQCRVVVFSPLEIGFDATVNVPDFFRFAINTGYNTVSGQPSLMDVPINRTKYRVYLDKVYSAKTIGNAGSGTIAEDDAVFIDSKKININQRMGDILYRQAGETTVLTNVPKYPRHERYIAVIPFHNIANGSEDNDTGAGLVNVMFKTQMYFTDS